MIITLKRETIYLLLTIIAIGIICYYVYNNYDFNNTSPAIDNTSTNNDNVDQNDNVEENMYHPRDMLYPDIHEHMKSDPKLAIDRMAYTGENLLQQQTCNTESCPISKDGGYGKEQERLTRQFGVTFTAPFDVNNNEEPQGLENDLISGHEDTMENGTLREHYIMDENELPPEYRRGRDAGVQINQM